MCNNIITFPLFKGGGTHDVSIITASKHYYRIMATEGDPRLGGQDFTRNLAELCVEKVKREYGVDIFIDMELMEQCEEAKRALSSNGDVTIQAGGHSITVTRLEFENKNDNLFRATIDRVKVAMSSAHLNAQDIKRVILTGGSSRIPKIRSLLSEIFGVSKIFDGGDDDLDELGMCSFFVFLARL